MHFTDILTHKLTADVKLVGPNISCGGVKLPGSNTTAANPHVQSFAVATDAVGLSLLRRNGSVFACHDRIGHTVFHSELGLSAVMLDAGYNLDCLMVSRLRQLLLPPVTPALALNRGLPLHLLAARVETCLALAM